MQPAPTERRPPGPRTARQRFPDAAFQARVRALWRCRTKRWGSIPKEWTPGCAVWRSGSTPPSPSIPGRPVRGLGYYANVLPSARSRRGDPTDGVGTKLLVAQHLGRYDTVGIDCVAMNVNDIICVGAQPVALLDYIAVHRVDAARWRRRQGVPRAGRRCSTSPAARSPRSARCSTAPRRPVRSGRHRGRHRPPQRVLIGQDVIPGDVVIGLSSTGLHSNGYTLARHTLLDHAGLSLEGLRARPHPRRRAARADAALRPARHGDPRRRPAGEGAAPRHRRRPAQPGAHRRPMGFVIDRPLPPQPIFALIQHAARPAPRRCTGPSTWAPAWRWWCRRPGPSAPWPLPRSTATAAR